MSAKTAFGSLLLLVLGFVLVGVSAPSQEEAGAGDELGSDRATMQEMMRLAQPGPEHELLAERAGDWETSVSVRMMPGAEPMRTSGRATSRTILGGRYLQVVSNGTMMGQPFESRSILGFDRRHEEYTIIGLDTMGTYWVTGKGQRDEDGVIRMHGEDLDPTGKQVYTFELEILNEDEHVFRVLFSELGGRTFDEPFPMVEVKSTRKG